MKTLSFHHEADRLPKKTKNVLPVQVYGIDGLTNGSVSSIGNPLIEPIQRLGVAISPVTFDFLTVAMAVTAADTFVQRKAAEDGWARELKLIVPLSDHKRWIPIAKYLEETLHFLSGDIWHFEFTKDGCSPPRPFSRRRRYKLTSLRGLDSVCLFSGGLDSTTGVIDLLSAEHKPLLVSHAYPKEGGIQDHICKSIKGNYSRFALNASPRLFAKADYDNDITMRTRSFNFLAFGALGADAVCKYNRKEKVELFVPENGFISLNAPLTPRRIGTYSTRTTHPYFISRMQHIFDTLGIPADIRNPYQFKTKGELIRECENKTLLKKVIGSTVSCSNWKRKGIQCGRCVPCLIRRSAFCKARIDDSSDYQCENLPSILEDAKNRDDVMALMIAIQRLKGLNKGSVLPWISNSGPLPEDPEARREMANLFKRGLKEVEKYLVQEDVL